ncbi:MAG TPA: enoyl-CoA hydratase/isomerase family protein, partial [Blastocatellia bacterium]|nr:enoyl-CoA hydratase/isomerase family protein [Blastocatellia bacterium]
MNSYKGNTLSWDLIDGCIELALHRQPCNEIGSATLEEMERFKDALAHLAGQAHALIIYSELEAGFSAGADLRELYQRARGMAEAERVAGVRDFLERIHGVLNAIDALPITTIAAVNGVTFGGGFELALVCDLIIADKMARFCFPELRLGLIPGFGGIPRLKRDIGNGVVRDLLLTGRSFNAQKALSMGIVSQVVSEGQTLRAARATAAQVKKFDLATGAAAGASVGANDIDNGVTSIRSPEITLPIKQVTLSFNYYLAHLTNATSADFLRVRVTGQQTTL